MSSDAKKYANELTTVEAKKFIDDLADFKVPVLLFSGGEPLIRPDFFELADYAAKKGVRPTLSTNGTLITRQVAQKIKDMLAFPSMVYAKLTINSVVKKALLKLP